MHAGESAKIRLGVSSCLLGERVRYDGYLADQAYLTPHPKELMLRNLTRGPAR